MCVMSMVMDAARDWWGSKPPYTIPPLTPQPTAPPITIPLPMPEPIAVPVGAPIIIQPVYNGPTREQFEEFLELLRAAKKFDEATGQPDCELEEKKSFIRKLAEHLGVPFPSDL